MHSQAEAALGASVSASPCSDALLTSLRPQEGDPAGLWEETFKSHTDSKPRGPEAVSMDLSFPGFQHVYGLPQHADNFDLRSTTGVPCVSELHIPALCKGCIVNVPCTTWGFVPCFTSSGQFACQHRCLAYKRHTQRGATDCSIAWHQQLLAASETSSRQVQAVSPARCAAGEGVTSEPYRLYNLDVFEYETDSRFGLYGAIPLLVAHSPERSVGAFWCALSATRYL